MPSNQQIHDAMLELRNTILDRIDVIREDNSICSNDLLQSEISLLEQITKNIDDLKGESNVRQ